MDVPNSISPLAFQNLRECYGIPCYTDVLQLAPKDVPTLPKEGFSAIHEASFCGGLRFPFKPVIQDLLSRLRVHSAQISPSFCWLVAGCYMMLHREKGCDMMGDEFGTLVTISPIGTKPGGYKACHHKQMSILTKLDSKYCSPWVWVSNSAFGTTLI